VWYCDTLALHASAAVAAASWKLNVPKFFQAREQISTRHVLEFTGPIYPVPVLSDLARQLVPAQSRVLTDDLSYRADIGNGVRPTRCVSVHAWTLTPP
jgi:hypothetical protein